MVVQTDYFLPKFIWRLKPSPCPHPSLNHTTILCQVRMFTPPQNGYRFAIFLWVTEFDWKWIELPTHRLIAGAVTSKHNGSLFPSVVLGQLRSTTGYAHLLMKQKLKQYIGLVDTADTQSGHRKTTAQDLQVGPRGFVFLNNVLVSGNINICK